MKQRTVLEVGSSVPDLDCPVSTTSDKDLCVILVPCHPIDGHVMSWVRIQERAGVCLGTDVKLAVL